MYRFWKILFLLFAAPPFARVTTAKEIVAKADEWTVIGENDTIDSGMHVRIDMTTGEKWVKLPDPSEVDASVALSVVGEVQDGGQTTETASRQASSSSGDNDKKPSVPAYDYYRMYDSLVQLPLEEHERMGGLPVRPEDPQKLTPEERLAFEERMREIWELRQAELRKIGKEQVIDLPELLRTQISFIREYWEANRTANALTMDLRELEYILMDVDMARDFYTLQGWPWLLSILVQPHNETSIEVIEGLQHAAAWVVGSAVGNTGEFRPWVVDPVQLPNGTSVTTLAALWHVWTTASTAPLQQKSLYALSACLRDNPAAQQIWAQQHEGPARLLQDLQETPADTKHGRKQILRILQLGQDLLAEWHESVDDPVIDSYRASWTTEDWCSVVLDKVRVVARDDKRLPILHTWHPYCEWEKERVHDLLLVDESEADADTLKLRETLLERVSATH
jgi:hypothetical protein